MLHVFTSLSNCDAQVTFDYCTSNDWPQDWACACGSEACRGRITGEEWQQEAVQAKYVGHFLPHIAARIARFRAEQ